MKEVIEIHLSKTKIILYFIGALIFVLLGIIFTYEPATYISFRYPSPTIIRIGGIASILFFGVCLIFITKKLLDSKTGLRITKDGIWDNTNVIGLGLIDWTDITGFKTFKISFSRIIIIKTNKPNKYIGRAKNGFAKRTMKSNYKTLGSPLTIMASALTINSDELENLLNDQLSKNKNALQQ